MRSNVVINVFALSLRNFSYSKQFIPESTIISQFTFILIFNEFLFRYVEYTRKIINRSHRSFEREGR